MPRTSSPSTQVFHGAHATRGSVFSLASGFPLTALPMASTRYDTDAYWAAGTPTRLTVPIGLAGYYIFGGFAEFAPNATGIREVEIWLNGGAMKGIGDAMVHANTAADDASVNVNGGYKLAEGDYIELRVGQDSGVALDIEWFAGVASPGLWLARIGI